MHPILFNIAGINIYAYGVMVALAFLSGLALMVHRARRAGVDPDPFLEATIWFIIAGLGGAKLLYFVWYPQQFLQNPLGMLLSQGGLVWYGGVLGVTLAVILYTRFRRLNLFQFSDIMIPSAALGLAIGRIGCLLAGCCFGSPTDLPWAIHYPHSHETHGIGVHPAPLYESVIMLLAVWGLLRVDQLKYFNGLTTGVFFILAGLTRFVLEYVRGDRLVPLEAMTLSNSQIISIFGILAGIGLIFALQRRHRNLQPPQPPQPTEV